ncbi:MAG: hypothetical protein U1A72_05600 [Sulfuritalea sp.]|nr:hypothetical protein [Sulfuritalea sp.]
MARILRRPLAGADIAEIWDYIAEDSVLQADAWVELHSARDIDAMFDPDPDAPTS